MARYTYTVTATWRSSCVIERDEPIGEGDLSYLDEVMSDVAELIDWELRES